MAPPETPPGPRQAAGRTERRGPRGESGARAELGGGQAGAGLAPRPLAGGTAVELQHRL